ncbi:MAG: 6-phosphogluconolactonase [Pseudomonadota bacterium]
MDGNRMIVEHGEFITKAADWIISAVDEAVRERGICHLMLAGGGTPLPVYMALARMGLSWGNLVLYFGDERCVPPDHTDSNYRAITESLFPQGIPQEVKLQRMRGEDDPELAARAYEAQLPERIDILLLGMGADGHTASLFPGSPALDETNRLVMPVIGTKPPPQRLTITPPVIRSARKILVMVEGAGKASAIQRVWETGDLPVALARQGDWLLDEAAASALSKSEVR